MGVDESTVRQQMQRGVAAVLDEFDALSGEWAAEARECLRYVLHEEAGSSDVTFQNGWKRDCAVDGTPLLGDYGAANETARYSVRPRTHAPHHTVRTDVELSVHTFYRMLASRR